MLGILKLVRLELLLNLFCAEYRELDDSEDMLDVDIDNLELFWRLE